MIPASLNTMMMGASNVPILDVVGSSAFAVSSARRLSSSNTSPFIAQRGNSGTAGATQNAIYDLNGNTDISNLTTFIGANNECGIPTWYDQSGNSNNATNATYSQIPLFYTTANGFFYINSRLCPYFSSSFLRNLALSSSINLASDYTIFVVVTPANDNPQLGGTSAANSGLNAQARAGTTNNVISDSAGFDLSTGSSSTKVACFYKLSGDRGIIINGVEQTTTATVQTRNNTLTHVGRILSGASNLYYEGRLAEIIVYNRTMTIDERNYVQDNLRTYYGV